MFYRIFFWWFMTAIPLCAQDVATSRQNVAINIYFRFDDAQLEPSYRENKAAYENFIQQMNHINISKVDSVKITALASPTGDAFYNLQLTKRRAWTIYSKLGGDYPELRSKMVIKAGGEAWTLLTDLIGNDPGIPWEEKTKLLSELQHSADAETKKRLLRRHPRYAHIKRQFFPLAQTASISLFAQEKIQEKPLDIMSETDTCQIEVAKIEDINESDSIDISHKGLSADKNHEADSEERISCMRIPFAFKTNLLLDAITAVNFALEIPMGRQGSMELETVCPWWHHKNKWAFQWLQVGAEGRYWFKRQEAPSVLNGHFGGIYVMGGKFDLQKRRIFCYQGEFWSTGLTYGYAMPVGKHFNMEFSLSVGYLSTGYQHYTPSRDYSELIKDPYKYGKFNYFGPTKLKVSLVYPIKVKIKKRGGHHE